MYKMLVEILRLTSTCLNPGSKSIFTKTVKKKNIINLLAHFFYSKTILMVFIIKNKIVTHTI